MSDESTKLKYPVLRVTQLDTSELDSTLLANLKHSINEEYFKYIQLNFVHRYHVEIFSALKFILWYYTFGKTGQTVAQSAFDWSYQNLANTNKLTVVLKKILHACFFCLDEWFEERFLIFFRKFLVFLFFKNDQNAASNFERKYNKQTEYVFQFYKLLTMINYMVFLFNGKFLTVWQRLLNLRPEYNGEQIMSESSSSSEASIRGELWHAYFALFKLGNSLFSFNKVYKKYVENKFHTNKSDAKLEQINVSECALCKCEPIMAHCSSNHGDQNACKHIFCYHCIKQEIMDDENGFICKLCSNPINEIQLFIKD